MQFFITTCNIATFILLSQYQTKECPCDAKIIALYYFKFEIIYF